MEGKTMDVKQVKLHLQPEVARKFTELAGGPGHRAAFIERLVSLSENPVMEPLFRALEPKKVFERPDLRKGNNRK